MKLEVKVEGMTCVDCEAKIENIIKDVKGIKSVDADSTLGIVTIDFEHKDDKLVPEIEKKIEELGFKVKEKHF